MNDKVKTMVKNVVEENAVGFKQATSAALYDKINNKLKDQYKVVAKKLFSEAAEAPSAAMGGAGQSELSGQEMVQATPGGQSGSGQSRGQGAPPQKPGDRPPVPVEPNRKKEPWKSMTDEEFARAIDDYRKQVRAYQEWQKKYQEWRKWKDRQNNVHPAERFA